MFENVLLPVDLNHDASWSKALPMAKKLAAGGKLHVLGIVHDFGAASVAAYFPKDFEEKALQHMKADLDAFAAAHCADVPVEVHVGHGHVPEKILAAAHQVGADVIVMASHQPDDLRTLLIGSYADKVVRHSDLPVMVVR